MPQLVKGGKHTFGWSKVGGDGEVVIPPEAVAEYRLATTEKAILISGSATSGGFSLCKPESLLKSPLVRVLKEWPGAIPFVTVRGRSFCRVAISKNRFILPPRALTAYGIKPGDLLLSIRGSSLGVGFGVRGPIIEEAKRHPELEVFVP
jgi:hypothetical protein